MSESKPKPIVLGLGNPLFMDEGLGIHAVKHLFETPITEIAEIVDGGTDGIPLLEYVERAETLIVIDAVDADLQPGSMVVWDGEQIPLISRPKLSPHQSSFQEVLALAKLRGHYPKKIKLFGIQPDSFAWGLELSPAVAASFDEMIKLLIEELNGMRVVNE